MFRLEKNDDFARLILDRPEARNAIRAAAWADLAEKFAVVESSEARMLVVSGAGGTFCAGADLDDLVAMRGDAAAIARFREHMRGALDRLRGLAIPTIALVEGQIGINYLQEDVHRLVALVGPGQAARMLFGGQIICGQEARHIGLVETNMPGEKALFEAILANDRDSLAALKQAIARAGEGVRSDPEADRRFDALIGGGEMARRLEALRRK
jgi:enoyl-CoA hydratase/carnithine racemase